MGPVSAVELRVLYQRALAVAYPSLYEGFGLPPLEAMAAGTPVVAMAFSSLPEVGGDAVLFADKLSVAGLAYALERLATDERLRSGLRERGLQRAAEFRWEKTAQATFEVYRSAVLEPAERSLRARRMLCAAILHWSRLSLSGLSVAHDRPDEALTMSQSPGVRNAWRSAECRSECEDAPRAETLQARQGSRDVLTSRGRRPPSARGKHRTPTGAPSLQRAPITSHSPASRRSRPRHHRRDMDARTKPSRL